MEFDTTQHVDVNLTNTTIQLEQWYFIAIAFAGDKVISTYAAVRSQHRRPLTCRC